MPWLAYSSDLNPIENLWDALGSVVSSRFPPPDTLIELKTALQEEWRLLSSKVVDHLIESIVTRCKLSIQVWGDSHTLLMSFSFILCNLFSLYT